MLSEKIHVTICKIYYHTLTSLKDALLLPTNSLLLGRNCAYF